MNSQLTSTGQVERALQLALVGSSVALHFARVADLGFLRAPDVDGSLALSTIFLLSLFTPPQARMFGARLVPKQGWRYWVLVGVVIGIVVLAITAVSWYLARAFGHPFALISMNPRYFPRVVLHGCFVAPVIEEAIYRLCLCGVLFSLFGKRSAIIASGFAFALLHVLGGNPYPNNLIAGFFLAWAFLQSESIVVPVALHSLGNLFVYLGHMLVWWQKTAA